MDKNYRHLCMALFIAEVPNKELYFSMAIRETNLDEEIEKMQELVLHNRELMELIFCLKGAKQLKDSEVRLLANEYFTKIPIMESLSLRPISELLYFNLGYDLFTDTTLTERIKKYSNDSKLTPSIIDCAYMDESINRSLGLENRSVEDNLNWLFEPLKDYDLQAFKDNLLFLNYFNGIKKSILNNYSSARDALEQLDERNNYFDTLSVLSEFLVFTKERLCFSKDENAFYTLVDTDFTTLKSIINKLPRGAEFFNWAQENNTECAKAFVETIVIMYSILHCD